MTRVTGTVNECYARHGVAGTVDVKLTISPAGTVTTVAATGAFAGTPTGACVEAAVRTARFPPFDGAPQSWPYTFLLAD